jgi:hypothetical protein
MDANDTFSRIWAAFEAGQILPACAWCGRVRIDEAWLFASPAALAAIDQRLTLSHSICDVCERSYTRWPQAVRDAERVDSRAR